MNKINVAELDYKELRNFILKLDSTYKVKIEIFQKENKDSYTTQIHIGNYKFINEAKDFYSSEIGIYNSIIQSIALLFNTNHNLTKLINE